MGKIKELSVFLPSYNEELNIKSVVERILLVLPTVAESYELIIVDDGSKDKTRLVVQELSKTNSAVRCIFHEVNRGYGAALRSGLYGSRFNWVAFTDADGQFDFSEITSFIERQRETEADLVVGYYLKRAVPWFRKVNSLVWQALIRLLFGLRVRDIDCGFKLISRKVVETIPPLESERGAFISTEFLVKAQSAGFKIVELGVHHYPRRSGVATGAKINVIVKSFVDLFRLWRKLR